MGPASLDCGIDQRTFLTSELFSLTLMATTQRAKLYRGGTTEQERKPLAQALQGALDRYTCRYRDPLPDSDHVANIDALAKEITTLYRPLLMDGRMRIGSAQKALNLHLKYMWCLGHIPMPPHCPIDSIVLARIPHCSAIRWTQLDSLSKYEEIIRRARAIAGETPLAVWELRLYNNGSGPAAGV